MLKMCKSTTFHLFPESIWKRVSISSASQQENHFLWDTRLQYSLLHLNVKEISPEARRATSSPALPERTFGLLEINGRLSSSAGGQTTRPLFLPLHIEGFPLGLPRRKWSGTARSAGQIAPRHTQTGKLPRITGLDKNPTSAVTPMAVIISFKLDCWQVDRWSPVTTPFADLVWTSVEAPLLRYSEALWLV